MASTKLKATAKRLLIDYGMLLVLLAICGYYSYATWDEQDPTGSDAGEQVASKIVEQYGESARVLIVARDGEEDVKFAHAMRRELEAEGLTVVATVTGKAPDAYDAISAAVAAGKGVDVIGANEGAAKWKLFEILGTEFPTLADTKIVTPHSYWWPNFIMPGNIASIADQIVVISILAIGVTMVIITGGIDLSVGSLIALSAVTGALLIRDFGGAKSATPAAMVGCCLLGIALCGVMGLFSGAMVTFFRIPPFIVTLSMMLVARGVAYILAKGQSIADIPATFKWLGHGADLFGIPNVVVLMVILYVSAHVMMSRTKLGRYVYAVGGNPEAARLSGVPVRRVLLFVYAAAGTLAGLGGVVMASQLKSGSPTFGKEYELDTIAAVVVGGTSLAGGEGKIVGTLIGAFIIGVVRNGMNLTGVESYTQWVVLGLVILAAVLLDKLKKADWGFLRRWRTVGGELEADDQE